MLIGTLQDMQQKMSSSKRGLKKNMKARLEATKAKVEAKTYKIGTMDELMKELANFRQGLLKVMEDIPALIYALATMPGLKEEMAKQHAVMVKISGETKDSQTSKARIAQGNCS